MSKRKAESIAKAKKFLNDNGYVVLPEDVARRLERHLTNITVTKPPSHSMADYVSGGPVPAECRAFLGPCTFPLCQCNSMVYR